MSSSSGDQFSTLDDSSSRPAVNVLRTRRLTALIDDPVEEEARRAQGPTSRKRPSGPGRDAMVAAPDSHPRAAETLSSGEASNQPAQHRTRAQSVSQPVAPGTHESHKSSIAKHHSIVGRRSHVKTVHYELPNESTTRRESSSSTTLSASGSETSVIPHGAPNDTTQIQAPPHGDNAQTGTEQQHRMETSEEESSPSIATSSSSTRFLAAEYTPSHVTLTRSPVKKIADGNKVPQESAESTDEYSSSEHSSVVKPAPKETKPKETAQEVTGHPSVTRKADKQEPASQRERPSTRAEQLRAAAKSSSRSTSGITLSDLAERWTKRPQLKTTAKALSPTLRTPTKAITDVKNTPTRTDRSIGQRPPKKVANKISTKTSTSSIKAFTASKIEDRLPLISQEECRTAARKGRITKVSTITLDDMAQSFRGKTWGRTRSLSPVASGDVMRPKRLPASKIRFPKTIEHAQIDLARRNLVRPADHETLDYRLSREELLLYPLAACLLVAFFIFLVFILLPGADFSKGPQAAKKPLGNECVSARCIKNAVYLNSLLSWDQDNPCRDFYAFVCRQWTGSYATPSAASFISSDDDYVAYLEGRLRALLQNGSSGTNGAVQPISDLYKKCMDKKHIEDDQWNPLLELMAEAFLEGFPFTPPVRRSLSIWKTAARLLRMTGTSVLFSVGVSSHPSTPDKVVMFIGPPRLLMTFDNADIDAVGRLYTDAAFAAVKALKKQYVPSSFIVKIVEFASELEKLVGFTASSNTPALVNLTSLPPLVLFLQEVFNDSRTVAFKNDSEVMISPFKVVNEVLRLARNAELHTVMNCLGVRLMIEVSPFIPDCGLTDFYGAFIYGRRRGGVPRWELCVRAVEKATFPLTYASILADLNAHVPTSRLTTLARQVIAEFQRSIASSPYFASESKLAIQSVLNATSVRTLGPQWVTNGSSIDAYAQKLAEINRVENKTALSTYVRFHEHTFKTSLTQRPSQRWSRSAFSPNCWYEPDPDTIYVPILAFNISHALDGGEDDLQFSRLAPRLYSCVFALLLSKKELPPAGRFTSETEHTLRNLEACIDPGGASKESDFKRTREILAVNFAYTLFINAIRTSREVFALKLAENRSLSEKQLFFVFLVLQVCEQSGDYENRASTTGHHWNIALSNTKHFGDVYACQPGSPMNTEKKCVDV